MAKVGCKGKYEYWRTNDGLMLIKAWARDGLTHEQIAHNIGINVATLYDWKSRFDDIGEALKRGREVVDFEVENALLKRALGYTVIENDRERYIPPDVGAMCFWLKNRKGDTWRDRKDVAVDANVRANPYQGLTEDELKKLAGGG